MNITIFNKKLSGEIEAPVSKSLAHRYLICQALTKEPTAVVCTNDSEDIQATKRCIKELRLPDSLGDETAHDKVYSLECGDSGSTFRFLLPIVAALGRPARFILGESLMNRPIDGLLKALKMHGIKHEYINKSCMHIWGRMTTGTFVIPGNISSQFVTGLLFALPLLNGSSTIIVQGKLESRQYVEMTLGVLKKCGIRIEAAFNNDEIPKDSGENTRKQKENAIGATFRVKGSQKYDFKGIEKIEGDWSNAAIFLVGGALCGGPVKVFGLESDSVQLGRNILGILKKSGADVQTGIDEDKGPYVTVSADIRRSSYLKAFDVDASDIPDIVPALALLASVADGITSIRNIERLKLKESDRVEAIIGALQTFGISAWENEGTLYVEGYPGFEPLAGGHVSSYNDHRIAMMEAVASCISSGRIDIEGAEAAEKSYPEFYKDLITLQN